MDGEFEACIESMDKDELEQFIDLLIAHQLLPS